MQFDHSFETIIPITAGIDSITIGGNAGLNLPAGSTAQRSASRVIGSVRINTDSTPVMEYWNGTAWVTEVTSFTAGSTGLTPNTATTGAITLAGILNLASGGTNAGLTAASGGVVYSSASAMAISAVGTSGQLLTSNGAAAPTWSTVAPASYSVNVGPAGTVAWTLVSGTLYNAVITHNLGTQNVVVQMADISTNNVVFPDLITVNSATQITVQVSGNLKTLRVVVIANGSSIAAGGSTPSSVIVQNSGVALPGAYTTVNLTGALTAVNSGGGVATISGGGATTIRTLTYVATSLDSPNSADWAISALAPTVADPVNGGLDVRQFSNTTEQGVGLVVPIPVGTTNITFTYQGRTLTAPGASAALQMRMYSRVVASATPTAVSAWSAANNLTSVTVPTNAFFQTYTQTLTLASLSLTAGNLYQFEITRHVGVSGNLAYNWLMVGLTISFT